MGYSWTLSRNGISLNKRFALGIPTPGMTMISESVLAGHFRV
jgi:hypothetical protein